MQMAASTGDKTGFYLLTLCGVLAPIPNGSTSPTAAGAIGIVLAVCLLCSLAAPPLADRSRTLYVSALALAGLVIVWALVQTLPSAAISDIVAVSLGGAGPPEATESASISNLQPLHSVGYVLIPFVAFMSALVFIRDDARYLTFLHILLGAGFVLTSACIVEYTFSPRTLLLQPKIYYLESFTGTFVNPNTAATYFGTMLLLSLPLCLRQFGQVRRHQHMIRAVTQPAPTQSPHLLRLDRRFRHGAPADAFARRNVVILRRGRRHHRHLRHLEHQAGVDPPRISLQPALSQWARWRCFSRCLVSVLCSASRPRGSSITGACAPTNPRGVRSRTTFGWAPASAPFRMLFPPIARPSAV